MTFEKKSTRKRRRLGEEGGKDVKLKKEKENIIRKADEEEGTTHSATAECIFIFEGHISDFYLNSIGEHLRTLEDDMPNERPLALS